MKWVIYALIAVAVLIGIIVLIGAALPKAHIAKRTIEIHAQPGDVFALIAGPSDWRGMKYELIAQSPLTWRETDSSGDAIIYERMETASPTRIVNRIADPKLPFGGNWVYEIAPSTAGTQLTITENGEVYNPIFRFVSRFIIGHAATIEKYQNAVIEHFK